MKHSYRNRIIFAVLAVGTIMTAMHAVTEKDNATADTTSISTDSPTMGSLQKDLIAYLNEKHPEIRFGSRKYMAYVTDVCMYDNADPELAKLPNYNDIQFYCAEYLHQLDEQQVKGIIPFLGFKPSEEFLSKTVEEIQYEAIIKQRLDDIAYQTTHRE